MTPQEYGKIAEWYAENKLQHSTITAHGLVWEDRALPDFGAASGHIFGWYRRRPDTQPMPDQVWLSEGECEVGHYRSAFPVKLTCTSLFAGNAIRYVRSDAVIDGERLEFCPKCDDREPRVWGTLNNCLIRFKP